MQLSSRIGNHPVLATTITMLVTPGGACRLRVTKQVELANAGAKRQRIITKLEKRVGIGEAADSAPPA